MECSVDIRGTCPKLNYVSLLGDFRYGQCSIEPTMTTGTTPVETAILIFHIFFTIVPILFSIAFVIVATRKLKISSGAWRFLLDFVIIVIPIILNVSVFNSFVERTVGVLVIVTLWIFWRNKLTPFVDQDCVLTLGHQPIALTLLRSTIGIITAVCILAIDFSSFPKSLRKSRTYGAGLMDTGIGLFVFSMGAVSKPAKTRRDFVKNLKVVVPALVLGLARTIVLQAIDYHQDDTEYGTHMNAFFTLGLTKLFGGLISAVASSNLQVLLLGVFVTGAHECMLQFGLADFVMDPTVDRETLFRANREGISSLPGFIGTYLLAMYISRLMLSESKLMISEYSKKIKKLTVAVVISWVVLLICVALTGISRRVCNLGYISWTFSIALTMFLFYTILCDYVFYEWSDSEASKMPPLMEATNRNGLLFFLVANILTGCVNMFLNPDGRGSFMSVLILSVYMLLSTTLVYVLLRLRIRIA